MNLRAKLVVAITMLMMMSGTFAAESNCRPFNEEFKGAASVTIAGTEYPVYLMTSPRTYLITRGLVDALKLETLDGTDLLVANGLAFYISANRVQGSGLTAEVLREYPEEVNPVDYIKNLSMSLFGAEIETGVMYVVESSELSVSLSTNQFAGAHILLDYPKSQVCILQKETFDLDKTTNVNTNYDRVLRNLVVEVTIEGEKLWLEFEPSYQGGVILNKDVAETLNLSDLSFDAGANMWSTSAVNLEIGPYGLGSVPLEFPDEEDDTLSSTGSSPFEFRNINMTSAGGGVNKSGLLGLEVLKHFAIIVDVESNQMFIEPGNLVPNNDAIELLTEWEDAAIQGSIPEEAEELIEQDQPASQYSVFEETKALAEQEDASAQWRLAQLFYDGSEVPESFAEAVRWFGVAADQGYLDAQLDLASMYADGRGVPQDYTEALRFYRMAATQGDASAQTILSSLYEDGMGVPQNLVMAYVWASLTAAQGNESARSNRDAIAARLTPEQFATGQDIATRCFASDYQDCE